MINTEEAALDAEARRFTERVTVYESPEMLAWLQADAEHWGRSTGAEIRAAIRFWRQANEAED